MKRLSFLIIGIVILIGVVLAVQILSISSFNECVKAGYPVQESYPARCTTPDGRTFTQQLANSQSNPDQSQLSTFSGEEVIFQYPSSWNPQEKEPTPGMLGKTIHLGIPEIESDQEAGFSSLGITEIKSDDIAQQEELIVDNRKWIKWIRKGDGYTSYDYYTDMGEKRSFGIHVTLGEENAELEKKLDTLVHSLTFK